MQMLVVEDNDAHAELMELAFRETEVTCARMRVPDAESALEELRRRNEDESVPQFGCVVLDVRLPGMSGLDLLREIRGDPELKYISVVMLTTSGNEHDREEAYKLGANSYVKKPFGGNRFHETMKDLQTYWCVHNMGRNGIGDTEEA